jgi:optic atrophy 3 protein
LSKLQAIKKRGEELAIEVQAMKQRISNMEQQAMKWRISDMEQQYAKWSLPDFRIFSFSTAQATPQPVGTQQPTAE